MKCNYVFAALLLLAGAATNASAQSEGVNLLTNGGFEGEVDMDGVPEGWTVGVTSNGGTVSLQDEGAHSGKNCIKIVEETLQTGQSIDSNGFDVKKEWFLDKAYR